MTTGWHSGVARCRFEQRSHRVHNEDQQKDKSKVEASSYLLLPPAHTTHPTHSSPKKLVFVVLMAGTTGIRSRALFLWTV